MPQPVNDIYEVVFVGELEGQKILNVAHYEAETSSIDIDDALESLKQRWIAHAKPRISDTFSFDRMEYRNLFNPSDAGEHIVSESGGLVSSPLPAHDTVSVQLIHDEPSIRNGRKAWAGAQEVDAAGSLLFLNAINHFDNATAMLFASPIPSAVNPAVTLMRPVVVKRVAELIGGVTRYRLPLTVLEALVGYVYDVAVDVYVRTQTQRKIGRGE